MLPSSHSIKSFFGIAHPPEEPTTLTTLATTGIDASHPPNEALKDVLRRARHLRQEQRDAALLLLEDLLTTRNVVIPATQVDRFNAAASVQWAMEQVLEGPEFIISPQLATPLRTYREPGQPAMQAARADGLIRRMQRLGPLRVVFCADGAGTPAQAQRFEDLVRHASACKTLLPFPLALVQRHFPPIGSGAIIFFEGPRKSAFAMKLNQGDGLGENRSISLFMDVLPVPPGASARAPRSGMDTCIGDVVDRWEHFLWAQAGDAWLTFCQDRRRDADRTPSRAAQLFGGKS